MDTTAYSSKTVLPAQGRRRFQADLRDATEALQDGLHVRGLWVTEIGSGEDEGSILLTVSDSVTNTKLVSLNILISDTSDYPLSHTWMCFTQDEHPPAFVLGVIESVSDGGSKPIREFVERLLGSLARGHLSGSTKVHAEIEDSDEDADEMEEGSDDIYMSDSGDEDYGRVAFGLGNIASDVQTSVLRSDFNQCVAEGFRPGLRHVGISELILSVSIPTFKLADTISPRALMAWDPRLLSASRHITLIITGIRGIYPILTDEGTLIPTPSNISPTFRVGLTANYKPTAEQCLESARTYVLQRKQSFHQPQPESAYQADEDDGDMPEDESNVEEVEDTIEHDDSFAFSLSTSLEALMNDCFRPLLELRVKYGLGWASAEALYSKLRRFQRTEEDVLNEFALEVFGADEEEKQLAGTYNLPADPLTTGKITHLNLPLLAFGYLLRRLTLCPRFCLICYDKIETDFQALKPYVCDDKLCAYQYYNLNRGPSLEYEICSRPQTVDLLVSLAYIAASEGTLNDFPVGMHLVVPDPTVVYSLLHPRTPETQPQMSDFDSLNDQHKRMSMKRLLDTLPPVLRMKKHLQKRVEVGVTKPKLQDMDPDVIPAAWSILRWCVASCTAHIEELSVTGDHVIGLASECRQFRFTVGSPDAEAKFHAEQQKACLSDDNARRYPSLYGWHGSPAKNWHSIIRNGLWYKNVANGRAYGHGVYFARQGTVSAGSYAVQAASVWSSSTIQVRSCFALAEIVNLPSRFTSSNPFYVVPQTDWIVCRYLMVNCNMPHENHTDTKPDGRGPWVSLDPQNKLTGTTTPVVNVTIPEQSHKLGKLLAARRSEFRDAENDEEDAAVFSEPPIYDAEPEPSVSSAETRPEDDWVHDPEWVAACVQHMLPPPVDATPMAVSSVQRELTSMLREQEHARALNELGWYLPLDFVGDNLFQWIVELHSFDPDLPVAKDMVSRNVNSLVFEIRFPSDFPHSPPFFRILKPRFLPFIQGGGGHITGGGSMCMDLLTSDGWLPSYSVSAILLQIKLAISNLDPRPARLAPNWDIAYGMNEALAGFKRAASTHGWKIPEAVYKMR